MLGSKEEHPMSGSVLVVDDDEDMCELVRDGLEKRITKGAVRRDRW